jgi:hypothetical protein
MQTPMQIAWNIDACADKTGLHVLILGDVI